MVRNFLSRLSRYLTHWVKIIHSACIFFSNCQFRESTSRYLTIWIDFKIVGTFNHLTDNFCLLSLVIISSPVSFCNFISIVVRNNWKRMIIYLDFVILPMKFEYCGIIWKTTGISIPLIIILDANWEFIVIFPWLNLNKVTGFLNFCPVKHWDILSVNKKSFRIHCQKWNL